MDKISYTCSKKWDIFYHSRMSDPSQVRKDLSHPKINCETVKITKYFSCTFTWIFEIYTLQLKTANLSIIISFEMNLGKKRPINIMYAHTGHIEDNIGKS